jgi:protein TonB
MIPNYRNTPMLDMVFENRNKQYGAYVLRNEYDVRIRRALFLTFTLLTLVAMGKYFGDKMFNKNHIATNEEVIIDCADVEMHKEDIKIEQTKPPVPQPQHQPQAQAIAAALDVEMNVVDNANTVDSFLPVEERRDLEAGLANNANGNTIGVTDGRGTEATYTVAVPEPVIESPITIAEIMPEFPGGQDALMRYLGENTSYPNTERDLGIEGKAYVRFIVNKDGSISDINVVKKDSPGFGKEGARVVAAMPKFKPGMQQGKPVRVQMVLPFKFKLND